MTNPSNTSTATLSQDRLQKTTLLSTMNSKLLTKGCGFTITTGALQDAPEQDFVTLFQQVTNRFIQTFGEEAYNDLVDSFSPTVEEVETDSNLVSYIIEQADEHQLESIYVGADQVKLMFQDLQALDSETLNAIAEALSADVGSVDQTYLLSADEKLDQLVQAGHLAFNQVRGMSDDEVLDLWDEKVAPTLVTETVEEESSEINSPEAVEVAVSSDSEVEVLEAKGVSVDFDFDDRSTAGAHDALLSDEDEDEDEDEFVDLEYLKDVTEEFESAMAENVPADQGYIRLMTDKGVDIEIDLNTLTAEKVERLNLSEDSILTLATILLERIVGIETMGDDAFGADDFEGEDELDEGFDDEDLDDHLDNPQFDEFDRFVTPLNVSNSLVLNFPISSEAELLFTDPEMRKLAADVNAAITKYDDEGESYAETLETTVNANNPCSKKSGGWLPVALRQVVSYLNKLSGEGLPALVGGEVEGIEFASSLGDSIAQVLKVLPDRANFGCLIQGGGLEDYFEFNNYLTVNAEVDEIDLSITNHFSILAPVMFHETKFTKALELIHRTVETRAKTADFQVVETFTVDAADAYGSYKHLIDALVESGFEMVSRSEANAALEAGEMLDAFDVLNVDIEDADEVTLDILFAESDLLLYKSISE